MHRSAHIVTLFSVTAFLHAREAGAQAGVKDEEALALSREAILVDYLAVQLDAAKNKLRRAVELCGENACSPHVIAAIHRDLGLLYAAGYKQHANAVAEFTHALAVESSIEVSPDLATDEVRAAYAEAAATLGIAVTPTPPAEKSSAEKAPELGHTPPAAQLLNTPVPIYVEPPPGIAFAKVRVRYRSFGVTDWKSVDLQPLGRGWGGEIPCDDVTTTGELEYYIQAYDAAGDVDTQSGTRQNALKVPIVHHLTGPAPHLPGRPPSAQCREANDCPPDFPGCADSGTLPPPILRPIERPLLRNWFSVTLEQDFLLVGTASGVCDPGSDYECFHADGRPFEAPGAREAGGEVVAGIIPATTRILVGYDLVFGRDVTGGARVGFGFGGGPKGEDGEEFFPFLAELRAAYFFGRDPFLKRGFRPFASAAFGIAQVDAKVPVNVFADQNAAETGEVSEVDAWRKTGLLFATLGIGTAFAIGDSQAVVAELTLLQFFGNPGTGLSLNIGYTLGIE